MDLGLCLSNLPSKMGLSSKWLGKNLARFDVVYVGAEFCELAFPPDKPLLEAVAHFTAQGKRVCVTTPPVTDRGIERLRRFFSRLEERFGGSGAPGRLEFSVNDLGTLLLLQELGLKRPVSMGRVLSGTAFWADRKRLEIRDNHIFDLYHGFGVGRYDLSSVGHPWPRTNLHLFEKLGIDRRKAAISLFYPYLNLTSTRNCFFRASEIHNHESVETIRCRRECEAGAFRVGHRCVRQKLIHRGNTVFLSFPTKPYDSQEAMSRLGIDRLVFCPFPPN